VSESLCPDMWSVTQGRNDRMYHDVIHKLMHNGIAKTSILAVGGAPIVFHGILGNRQIKANISVKTLCTRTLGNPHYL